MLMLLKIAVIFFTTFTCLNSELISVVVLFRHGDRPPLSKYKNDPYDVSYWPVGYGQLTNWGKNQHYDRGSWLKERYIDFLPSRYTPQFLKVQSSSVDRCLMSASSHLAGLWPPQGDQIWNENLLWQPIPVHSMSKGKDALLAHDVPCPKYNRLYDELMETEEFQTFFEDNSDLFKFVSENSGENIKTLLELKDLYNILYIEKLYNLTLPDWAEQVYDQMEDISNRSWTTYTYTQDMARLWSGPLINHIASNFESHLNNEVAPSYLMLSAHDTTLTTILNSLGLYDNLWPEYASTVIFELITEPEIEPFVNIFYKNSTHLKNLTLDNCDFDCNFEKFQEIVQPIRVDVDTWKNECNE